MFGLCPQAQLSGMDNGKALANHIVETLSPSLVRLVGQAAATVQTIVQVAHAYSPLDFANLRSLVISLPHLHLLCCIPGHWKGWLRPSTNLHGAP